MPLLVVACVHVAILVYCLHSILNGDGDAAVKSYPNPILHLSSLHTIKSPMNGKEAVLVHEKSKISGRNLKLEIHGSTRPAGVSFFAHRWHGARRAMGGGHGAGQTGQVTPTITEHAA